jgi:1D-myo-inositol 3-kinase
MRSLGSDLTAPPPSFVVVGHVTEDVTPSGRRLGGTASYAAAVAARLGVATGIVTRCAPDLDLARFPEGVTVSRLESEVTTVIQHQPVANGRRQTLLSRAAAIAPNDVPADVRAAQTVLLGPVIGEVEPAVAAVFDAALVGAAAQGWLRIAGVSGELESGCIAGLHLADLAGHVSVLTLSDEDLSAAPLPKAWLNAFPTVIVTDARNGLRLWHGRRWWRLAAFPAREADPTGAGDAFAAAFLIGLAETGDIAAAARFGAAAASFIVEGPGIAAAADRAAIQRRLDAYPEVVLTAAYD